jgi:hypothetical protein
MLLYHHRKITGIICYLLSLAVLNLTIGCTHYTANAVKKSMQVPQPDNTIVKRDYVVVHLGTSMYKLTELKVDAHSLMGKSHKITPSTTLTTDTSKSLADEVHLYVKGDSVLLSENVYIPLHSIDKIEILSTTDHHLVQSIAYDKVSGGAVAGIVVFILLAVVVIVVIAAIASCSCPMVDQYDGETYRLSGEAFSGAVFPNLERDDYLMLKEIPAVNGNYQIKISNKLDEKQYTDLARLMVIEHPDNTRAFIDKYGNVLTTSAEVVPEQAVASDGKNYTPLLTSMDDKFFSFTDEPEGKLPSSITMTFSKPKNTATGKLIVSAGNSIWADYVFSDFYKLFGNKYAEWIESQEKVPAHKHLKWMTDQYIPLMVYIETAGGWEFADYYFPVGSFSSRDMAMTLDLSKVKESDQFRIKIETGFMFWDLNYAAMDFTKNAETEIIDIAPTSAVDNNHADVIASLSADDGKYLEHLSRGDEVALQYKAPVDENNKVHTVYLHSKGYFQQLKNFDNEPDVQLLKSFRKPGRLTEFSKEKYTTAGQQYTLQK